MSFPETVAIIPVRSGSVGIPRKNARQLCGKPLLAYAIETAQAAKTVSATYVSTEDAELAEIARRYGAKVIDRPRELAGPATALDEVLAHAATSLQHAGQRFEYVATIQATCPLLRPSTLDEVMQECRRLRLDTILTVVKEAHLEWQQTPDGGFVPAYAKRANRQELPSKYRETGGVIACRRKVLDSGTRFGSRVGVFEVSKTEAIDIDDRFDWWMAEKSLQRRKIVFRVVGNLDTGLGHVYRCLTLADRIVDHDVLFITTPEDALATRAIQARRHPVQEVSATELYQAMEAWSPDLVVNDILDASEAYMCQLRGLGCAVLNLEDMGPGSMLADCVINAMYDEHPDRGSDHAYHGVEYCVLRDEFYTAQRSQLSNVPRQLLLLFGGTDPNDLTRKCLRWLGKLQGGWEITVVVGLGYPYPENVKDLAAESPHSVEVVVDTPVISRYMSQAHVAFTSAGRTVFELASLAVPMVVIPQNARELTHVFARSSPGTIFLSQAKRVKEHEFLSATKQVLGSPLLRQKMHEGLLSIDIHGGIDRALAIVEKLLPPSEAGPTCV